MPRHDEIWLDFVLRHVPVRAHVERRARRPRMAVRSGFIEPVAQAICIFGLKGLMRVAHIIRRSQRLRLQLHSLAEGVFSGAHRIRAWKTIEEIVRRPVFLNDDDHVLKLATTSVWKAH